MKYISPNYENCIDKITYTTFAKAKLLTFHETKALILLPNGRVLAIESGDVLSSPKKDVWMPIDISPIGLAKVVSSPLSLVEEKDMLVCGYDSDLDMYIIAKGKDFVLVPSAIFFPEQTIILGEERTYKVFTSIYAVYEMAF